MGIGAFCHQIHGIDTPNAEVDAKIFSHAQCYKLLKAPAPGQSREMPAFPFVEHCVDVYFQSWAPLLQCYMTFLNAYSRSYLLNSHDPTPPQHQTAIQRHYASFSTLRLCSSPPTEKSGKSIRADYAGGFTRPPYRCRSSASRSKGRKSWIKRHGSFLVEIDTNDSPLIPYGVYRLCDAKGVSPSSSSLLLRVRQLTTPARSSRAVKALVETRQPMDLNGPSDGSCSTAPCRLLESR
ncbi:hypothetical protein Forpi1262_v017096 [Fusarium oxysporum f. sp. raphani]|uniref:Uncharacterized protein n=1 Tax=Fusarium oxysporum f. sp. raphani TaxID=96318 RepID=A0A8J5NU98_FUSOX|nr:hypothetical protein Forpi1262_v017096 [Fusarium oxysporum f. sp. raphani]